VFVLGVPGGGARRYKSMAASLPSRGESGTNAAASFAPTSLGPPPRIDSLFETPFIPGGVPTAREARAVFAPSAAAAGDDAPTGEANRPAALVAETAAAAGGVGDRAFARRFLGRARTAPAIAGREAGKSCCCGGGDR